ncbi:MAG: signal peptidase II [Proteobacteria bacterium]|jgi:signal peptidase II|nr:signal peptidase II [Desulfocapsa sp.]MBU3945765.1 signal peptidase II [Pseudomonadota bacterium]MCG2745411.1 signal peptidase II [Desulfobacteraceae bacterium]MDO8945852.1 signal peptidase II [Desulfocapsaceae bacterium]MBU3983813.1 signal peptidase II [Pseudomonadota bacterium]
MIRFLAIVAAVVVGDQLTKLWILNSFSLYESLEIIPGFFSLTYLTNKGAAFGFLAGQTGAWRHYLFLVLGAVALMVIVIAWFRMRHAHWLYSISLPLIGGGALGNLIDRIRHGSVVDFLDVFIGTHHWPAFNVADSAISIGVAVFLLANILEDSEQGRSSVAGAKDGAGATKREIDK